MIVGTSKLKEEDLVKYAKTVETFHEYCIQLIPEEFRHIQPIVNNQIYLCCLCLRKCDAVPWNVKKDILQETLKDVRIVGYTNELIDFVDILVYVGRR